MNKTNKTTTGWIMFMAAIGMMCGLMSADVAKLASLSRAQILTPSFVSSLMAHLGTVILAFVGGKLIPTDRDITERTRSTDKG